MPLEAPEALLFSAIMDRLQDQVPELRYIEQDMGQLEHYSMKPAVSFPCALVDFDDFDFSDADGLFIQMAEGFVQLRLAMVQYTQSNNLTPANLRPNALKYLDTAYNVNKALHGWAPAGFGRLLRRKAVTERRDDDIMVKILRYAVSYKDVSCVPVRTAVPRPAPVIGTDVTT